MKENGRAEQTSVEKKILILYKRKKQDLSDIEDTKRQVSKPQNLSDSSVYIYIYIMKSDYIEYGIGNLTIFRAFKNRKKQHT